MTTAVLTEEDRVKAIAQFEVGDSVRWHRKCGIFLAQEYEMVVTGVGFDHAHASGLPHADTCYRRENLAYDVAARMSNGVLLFRGRFHAREFYLYRAANHITRYGPNWTSSHEIPSQYADHLIQALEHLGVSALGLTRRTDVAKFIANLRGQSVVRTMSRLPRNFEWWPLEPGDTCPFCGEIFNGSGVCDNENCPGDHRDGT